MRVRLACRPRRSVPLGFATGPSCGFGPLATRHYASIGLKVPSYASTDLETCTVEISIFVQRNPLLFRAIGKLYVAKGRWSESGLLIGASVTFDHDSFPSKSPCIERRCFAQWLVSGGKNVAKFVQGGLPLCNISCHFLIYTRFTIGKLSAMMHRIGVAVTWEFCLAERGRTRSWWGLPCNAR